MNLHQRLVTICSITAACLLCFATSCKVLSRLRTPCLSASTAAWISKQRYGTLLDCYWASRQAVANLQSVGFVQLDSRYLSCALFRYRDICQLLNMTSLAASRTQQQPVTLQQECEGFMDTKYDVLTANAYFAAVWVGGHGPALENLVCGPSGPRNPVLSSGVSWTPEGAQMNGATSRLMVNDSTGFNFSLGYTMALELRRQPAPQEAFMEMTDCSTFSVMLDHLVENPARGLYSYNNIDILRTAGQLLTADPNEFIKVALTCDRTANLRTHFYGTAAVPGSAFLNAFYLPSFNSVNRAICLKIGFGHPEVYPLNGTLKMAAIANSKLPDDVVLRFLAGN